jgi:hypothetical protein
VATVERAHAADAPTEYQVKAAFLFNFAKYVDWPPQAFADATAPLVIGLVGADAIGDDLAKTIAGRSVNNRPLTVQRLPADADFKGCHLLFVGAAERHRQAEILGKVKGASILSVGEADNFLEQGGVMNFVKRDNRIRFQVNLDAARQAQLNVSSKLLGVAESIKGKAP